MLTVKSSLIRLLFVAAFAGVCLFSQAKTASAQPQGHYQAMLDQANALNGTFAGELICVSQRPTCRNEKVVLRFEPIGQNQEDILLLFDFARGGLRSPFFRQVVRYEPGPRYFSGKFLTARDLSNSGDEVVRTAGTTFTYTITVTNNGPSTVEGTISSSDGKTIVRRIKLRRVKPNQVPPPPSTSSYPSF